MELRSVAVVLISQLAACAMVADTDAGAPEASARRDAAAFRADAPASTDAAPDLDAALRPDAPSPRDGATAADAVDVPPAHDAAGHDAAPAGDGAACLDALPNPSRCGYPDGTNTGVPAGTHLTRSGSIEITTPGMVVEGLEVTGTVTILASHVTFRNSIVHGQGYYAVHVTTYTSTPTTGVVIDHIEVDGGRQNPSVAGVVGDGFTLTASNVHGTGDGVDLGDDATVSDCWIHDLFVAPGDHTDGMQSAGGGPATARHNTIDARCDGCNSAVIMGADLGDISTITLTDNLFAGGNYTAYAGADPGHDSGTIVFTGNRFTHTYGYGPCSFRPSAGRTIGFTGNTWDADGTAVTGCD